MAPVSFPWPAVDGAQPSWTGAGFRIGSESAPVLSYGHGPSGWSESLTDMVEAIDGDGRHPIDVASRNYARAMLKRRVKTPPAETALLEVGCSSGHLLAELLQDWPDSLVIGSDFIEGPLQRLAIRFPQLPLLRFDLTQCPLPSASVDGVVLLNVLEHIEEDRKALSQLFRVLKPGGVVLIEVPAGPGLYDVYDKYLQHFRRYRLSGLCRLVEEAGFQVCERTHLGCLAYPMFAFVKRRNRRFLKLDEAEQRRVVEANINFSRRGDAILGATLAAEARLGRWLPLPVGIRCVVTATKPLA